MPHQLDISRALPTITMSTLSSIRRHFRCAQPIWVLLGPNPSPMHPPWRYTKFLKILVASSRSERIIAALPNLGLSTGDRTAYMSWHRQFIAIFAVLNHFTCFLGYIPHQRTLPDWILDFYSFWLRLADLRRRLMRYLISNFLQVREPHRWVDIFNPSKCWLWLTIVHGFWAIYITSAPFLTVYSISSASSRFHPILEEDCCII